MPKLQFCVYVLQNLRDSNLYVGFTTDLHDRLTAHFHGQVESTAHRRPFRLVFCEYHFTKPDALRREQYLKTTAGKNALRLMLRIALAAPSPQPATRPATSTPNRSVVP